MKLGNYELDDIYCGDSAVMLAGLPDACIDLTCTSPPYDNLRSYHGYSWDFTAIATQLYRVTKPGGVGVWVVGDATINGSETGSSFRQALGFMEVGFGLWDTMIYYRKSPPLTHPRYEQHFEYMFVFSKGTPQTFNGLVVPRMYPDNRKTKTIRREKDGSFDSGFVGKGETVLRGNVWEISAGGGHSTKDECAHDHPAIFPEALARDHIISWSNPGDIILDPFAGSGTTAKMSKVLSRHWLGFDISQEYVDLARRRVDGANVPLPLFVESVQPKPEQTSMF